MRKLGGILFTLLCIVGYAALAFLLFACLTPVYSMLIIFPVTFLFGSDDTLYRFELAATYGASAITALWLVRRIWSRTRKETVGLAKTKPSTAAEDSSSA